MLLTNAPQGAAPLIHSGGGWFSEVAITCMDTEYWLPVARQFQAHSLAKDELLLAATLLEYDLALL
jgi:hypothetical protein